MSGAEATSASPAPVVPVFEGYPRWSQPSEPYATFPKVTLHDHLDGSLRPETLIELAGRQGVTLPYDDPEKLTKWFTGEITVPTIENWDEKFGLTTRAMQTEESIVRVAREWVLEAAADGVVYGETRWAPEKHILGGLPLRVAVEAVAAGLAEGEALVAAAGGSIRARQLICGMRTSTLSYEIARLVVDTYGEWGGSVAGFDLAGAEDGFPVRHHLDATTLLEREGIPFTIHTGEADGEHSVWETVHLAHALRLGHGVRVIEDVTLDGRPLGVRTAVRDVAAARAAGPASLRLGRTAQWVVDRRIPLEVCVTSNAGGVVDGVANHPIDLLRELGFTVTVNPDNRGMSTTSISAEMRTIEAEFGWGPEEFAEAEFAAVEAAFLSRREREALHDTVEAGVESFVR
ncbi:adenosine deaminase family protein [Herbiconiux ginsengi]|uniref:adenosine deaminase n=1 Tax=Herbiconiux ginsengi TaxID=381665 RepID=A0A1H3KFT1_9MICO|nr:adenosine deaminase family protein [Herbiconiux ginsengi]SDY50966.1 adenosine deaminase [Herbiconiux ginsengi]